jgi:hypothetical protein
MSNNSSEDLGTTLSAGLQVAIIAPEYFNFIFLFIAIYGMYHGIEIQHPLYAVLFSNIVFPLLTTSIDIVAFPLINNDFYVRLSNSHCWLCLSFHCTSWLTTSVVRYLYIHHNDWLHRLIGNVKVQCFIAVGLTCVVSFSLSVAPFGFAHVYCGRLVVGNA